MRKHRGYRFSGIFLLHRNKFSARRIFHGNIFKTRAFAFQKPFERRRGFALRRIGLFIGRPAKLLVLVRLAAGQRRDDGGMGLVLMRERAELLGGTLRAGPDGEDWHVCVAIPTKV